VWKGEKKDWALGCLEDLFNRMSVEGGEKRLGAGRPGKSGNRNKSKELGKDK